VRGNAFLCCRRLPLRGEIQPFDVDRRATHVARESFQLLALLRLYANPRVQRESRALLALNVLVELVKALEHERS
jgi:hypothetical protein